MKDRYRIELKNIRASLTQERREKASFSLFIQFLPFLAYFENVLSFASFGHEIDTSLLNQFLARTNRLLLPKASSGILKIFKVNDPGAQLIPNSFGLYEPNPLLCDEIDSRIVQIALVPALGFDLQNHRLGYGKGYYDHFLKQTPHAQTIGIGFKEQLITKLPTDINDISLEKVSLF